MDRSLLDEIAAATHLREGAAGVEALVRAVHRAGSLRLADAARAARLPLPLATAIRRELEKRGVFARAAGLTLSKAGRDWAREALGLVDLPDPACTACAGHGLILPPPLRAALATLERHLANEPPVDVSLDQAPATAETALRRVALMLAAGALEGRRVLLLGDDDSLSLAIALAAREMGVSLTRRLTVIELDPRRAGFIEGVAADERLPIEVVRFDARAPLPRTLAGAFDVAATDPPYTLAGAHLFLARAREGLERGAGEIFFSFAHWPPARMLELMEVFVELGLAVRAMRPGFNAYRGASLLGQAGQMIELVAVGPAPAPLPPFEGPLYTAEIAPRERDYRCTRCGRTFRLGSRGIPATIEALKAAGCPACGNGAFSRRPAPRQGDRG